MTTSSDTIPGLLLAAAERAADDTWLRTDDGTLTFAQAASAVAAVVGRLRAAGVVKGDLVVVTPRTTPPYLLVWLALTSLGAAAVTVNPASTATELAGLVGQVRPHHVITDDDVAELVGDWSRASYDAELAVDVTADDLAVLIPTSGTTGRSKLVMQTHRAYAWAGVGFPFWLDLHRDDVLMTTLPLFHVNAPAYSVMGSLACGAGLVLVEKFSPGRFIETARRHHATEFNAIGAMLEMIVRQPPQPDDADTDLRLCYTGPSPAREWQEAFEARFGLRIVCGYALSESPYGLIWPRGQRPFGTLGVARQHPTHGQVNEARVVDKDGSDVAAGGTGELLLRNPVVTPGYWEMPDETAATVVDGWLHTGDLVTVNTDSTYTFVARKKEVLRRRGENVSPAEIEEAIAAHPAVLECAVVGVASELSEEEIKAFLVVQPSAALDFADVHAWAAQRLTRFKVPRFWQVVDALPRTPTQRVAKHLLPAGHPPDEYDAEPEQR